MSPSGVYSTLFFYQGEAHRFSNAGQCLCLPVCRLSVRGGVAHAHELTRASSRTCSTRAHGLLILAKARTTHSKVHTRRPSVL